MVPDNPLNLVFRAQITGTRWCSALGLMSGMPLAPGGTSPGGDHDSIHSAEVDYADLLPSLFQLKAGNIYMQMAGEKNPEHVLAVIKEHIRPQQRVFVGVIDVPNPDAEEPELVRDRTLRAAEYIPINQLGSTDDCGFSPFENDMSTGRDTAFAKIRTRVIGTGMAAEVLGC